MKMETSFYQTFDFLGEKTKASDSPKKFELSKLDSFGLKGKNVLDVGCKTGYFLFRLLEKEPNFLVGVDTGDDFIKIANTINEQHFKSKNICFIRGNFFNMSFGTHFDLVLCISTFHYFNDQSFFISKAHGILNNDGVLLLEVEEHPDNSIAKINYDIRPADMKRYPYPNQKMIEKWVQDKFVIEDKYISVKQGGTLYERYFYKLKKN